MNLRYLFFNNGIYTGEAIFGGVTLLTVITIIFKITERLRVSIPQK